MGRPAMNRLTRARSAEKAGQAPSSAQAASQHDKTGALQYDAQASVRATNRATLIGLVALVMWGMFFGFVRQTSVAFGEYLGPALAYSIASVFTFIGYRPSKPSELPWKYVVVSGGLFVFYECAISLSIGMASSSEQTLEISLVNYLWPSILVLMGAFAAKYGWLEEGHRAKRKGVVRRVLPGVVVATAGVVLAVGGNNGLDPQVMAADVASNPVPFALCFAAAAAWAVYSTFTGVLAKGTDATAYFLGAVGIALWIDFALHGCPLPAENVGVSGWLSLAGAAGCIAAGYACWGYGIQHGDAAKMGVGSYAAPLLSVIGSVVILGVHLTPVFWLGTLAVVAGSLIDLRLRR